MPNDIIPPKQLCEVLSMVAGETITPSRITDSKTLEKLVNNFCSKAQTSPYHSAVRDIFAAHQAIQHYQLSFIQRFLLTYSHPNAELFRFAQRIFLSALLFVTCVLAIMSVLDNLALMALSFVSFYLLAKRPAFLRQMSDDLGQLGLTMWEEPLLQYEQDIELLEARKVPYQKWYGLLALLEHGGRLLNAVTMPYQDWTMAELIPSHQQQFRVSMTSFIQWTNQQMVYAPSNQSVATQLSLYCLAFICHFAPTQGSVIHDKKPFRTAADELAIIHLSLRELIKHKDVDSTYSAPPASRVSFSDNHMRFFQQQFATMPVDTLSMAATSLSQPSILALE